MADFSSLQAWTPAERESFFQAIARHRRMAWRVAAASRLCTLIISVVVATLMAPIFYMSIGLVLDVANFLVPTPNLIRIAIDNIGALVDSTAPVAKSHLFYLVFMAALPGLVFMGLVVMALNRMIRELALDDVAVNARPPRSDSLAEQRFANVVGEMSVAANLPPPRVLVRESGATNAVAAGPDEHHVTILVSTGLLELLNREQMQAVAGDLVGAVANGDVGIGLRVARTLSLFGLLAKLSQVLTDAAAWKRFIHLLREVLRPGSAGHERLLLELADPFAGETSARQARPAEEESKFRKIMWVPLAGPVVFAGFFSGLVSTFVLEPLLAVLWRRRKYLADATAVRLTRSPDALADALEKLGGAPTQGVFSPWMAHMSVLHSGMGSGGSVFGASPVPMFPSLQRRLKALGRMGATVHLRKMRLPLGLWFIFAPLIAIAAVLMCVVIVLLVYLSAAISMLMTGLPASLLNALLRWLAS